MDTGDKNQNTEVYKNKYGWTATIDQVWGGYLLTVTRGDIVIRRHRGQDRVFMDRYIHNYGFYRLETKQEAIEQKCFHESNGKGGGSDE